MSSLNQNPSDIRVRILQAPSRPLLEELVNKWLAKPDVAVGQVLDMSITARGSALCVLITYRHNQKVPTT